MMINKLLAALILVALVVGGPSLAAVQESERPDVLFISVDDLNDWVGFLGGHPQARTPNLDRLAERGMVFANAHTVSTSCNPSRTALMTGLRPSTTGVYANGNDWRSMATLEGIPTIPDTFRSQGYDTFGAGKVFHAHTYAPQGFFGLNDPDAWDAFYPSIGRQLPDEIGPLDRPTNGNPGFLGFDWSPVVAEDSATGDGQVVSWAERQLAATPGGPRFLATGIYRPHLPWYVPQKYLDMHPLEMIEVPPVREDDLDDVPEIARSAQLRGNENHEWVLQEGLWEEAVRGYLASTSFADAMIGRLLDALDASGRADQTIIVLWSDHGFHLGEKGRWRKWSLWEEVTHIPFIIVAPGVTTPGSRTAQPVSLLDIYPTLMELTGMPAPEHLEGKSLVPLLEDPDAEWDHAAVTTNGYMEHSVRDERYRYTRHADGTEEVYDLETDPQEWENLAGDPAFDNVKQRLSTWLPTVNVPRPGR